VLRDLEHGDGDKALEEIAHMRDELATALDHEEVSPDDAQRIQAAIDRLASSVDQLGSTGSGGSQDEGGNGD
jgi:predicted ArsR family transcriptional regulator